MNYLEKSTFLILLKLWLSKVNKVIELPTLDKLYKFGSEEITPYETAFRKNLSEIDFLYTTFKLNIDFQVIPLTPQDNEELNQYEFERSERIARLYYTAQESYLPVLKANKQSLLQGLPIKYLVDENICVDEYINENLIISLKASEESVNLINEFMDNYLKNFKLNTLSGKQCLNFQRHLSDFKEYIEKICSSYNTNHVEFELPKHDLTEELRMTELLAYLHSNYIIEIKQESNKFSSNILEFSVTPKINILDKLIGDENFWIEFKGLKSNTLTSETFYNQEEVKFQSPRTQGYKFLVKLIKEQYRNILIEDMYNEVINPPNDNYKPQDEHLKQVMDDLFDKLPVEWKELVHVEFNGEYICLRDKI